MRKLFAYLKYRAALLLLYVFAAGATLLVAYLGGQDMVYARYSALLISFFFLLLLLIDGARFYRKRRALARLSASVLHAANELPVPDNALEEDYTALINELFHAYGATKKQLETARFDSLEYYTLWVHQIKTPIAALHLVLSQMDGDEAGVIKQELFKIERYADLALRYVKLEDISSDLLIEPCDLYELARACVKKFSVLFVYQKLSVEIAPFQWQVLSDKRWLAFVLEQVLSNALKYTSAGGIRIYTLNGALVVHDSGIGIRSEDLPRIFTKGYTGFNGRTDNRASGIGLYLAKKTADALKISLKVESAPGKGTKVFFRFPSTDTSIFK
ncbi:MAG TPA: sensor histidine kinase [Clostridia bacterium]|nr:sensor histidine kinase [Clostridia bacterium]